MAGQLPLEQLVVVRIHCPQLRKRLLNRESLSFMTETFGVITLNLARTIVDLVGSEWG